MADQNPNPRTDIPHHLIYQEILTRLPIKLLIKFKSVASEWNSYISSVEFTKTHFLRHSHLSSSFVLTHEYGAYLPFKANEFDGNHILDSNRFDINIKGPYTLMSSCNGLVLLISSDHQSDKNPRKLPYDLHLFEFRYVVYNPILGGDHFIEIPHPNEYPLGDYKNINYNFGFGYVSSRDDYYIVAIHSQHNSNTVVHIYSIRSHQWKTDTGNITGIQPVSPMRFRSGWFDEVGTLVAETLHWGISVVDGSNNFCECILAYELNVQDKGTVITLPETGFRDYFGLCCLNGCLCAWAKNNKNADSVEMWMMTEYGVCKSWTRLFRFQSNDYVVCHQFIGSISPRMALALASTREGKLILVDFSCDPPIISNTALESRWEAVSYVPSLVSVFDLLSEPRE